MAGTIAPFPKHQFFDNNGDPADGYQLFVYSAGTTTKVNTYSDVDLTSANTNPIILDAAGRCTIFLDQGSYKFVFTDPDDTDPPTGAIWTVDSVSNVPGSGTNVDVSGVAGESITAGGVVYIEDGGLGTAGRWYQASNFTMAESAGAAKVGIAMATASVGESFLIRTAGRVTNLTGLTPGTIYYLSDTDGALEQPTPDPEGDFELPYAFGFADTATSLVFPLSTSRIWGDVALRSVGFGAGQGCTSGSVDTTLTNYECFLPADYLDTAGNALIIEGSITAAANTNAKVLKVKVGSGSAVTVWSDNTSVAGHVLPFRFAIQRRTSTTGSIKGFIWEQAATAGTPTPYMTVTTIGTVDWTANQLVKFLASGGAQDDILLTDVIWYAIRTENGAVV